MSAALYIGLGLLALIAVAALGEAWIKRGRHRPLSAQRPDPSTLGASRVEPWTAHMPGARRPAPAPGQGPRHQTDFEKGLNR